MKRAFQELCLRNVSAIVLPMRQIFWVLLLGPHSSRQFFPGTTMRAKSVTSAKSPRTKNEGNRYTYCSRAAHDLFREAFVLG